MLASLRALCSRASRMGRRQMWPMRWRRRRMRPRLLESRRRWTWGTPCWPNAKIVSGGKDEQERPRWMWSACARRLRSSVPSYKTASVMP
jgi:hypothetical protein